MTLLIALLVLTPLTLIYCAIVKRIGEYQKREMQEFVKANPHLFPAPAPAPAIVSPSDALKDAYIKDMWARHSGSKYIP